MSNTSEFITIIRPSFMSFCKDACRAAAFNHLLFRIAGKAKDQPKEKIQAGDILWYAKTEQITEEMSNAWGVCKIRKEVNALIDMGIIGKRNNPEWGADRTKHFCFGQEQCKKFLALCQENNICVVHLGLSAEVTHLIYLSNANDTSIKCICSKHQMEAMNVSNANDTSIRAITIDSPTEDDYKDNSKEESTNATSDEDRDAPTDTLKGAKNWYQKQYHREELHDTLSGLNEAIEDVDQAQQGDEHATIPSRSDDRFATGASHRASSSPAAQTETQAEVGGPTRPQASHAALGTVSQRAGLPGEARITDDPKTSHDLDDVFRGNAAVSGHSGEALRGAAAEEVSNVLAPVSGAPARAQSGDSARGIADRVQSGGTLRRDTVPEAASLPTQASSTTPVERTVRQTPSSLPPGDGAVGSAPPSSRPRASGRKAEQQDVTQAELPPAPKFHLTEQEEAFWDLWCGLWFNKDVPPDLNERAYGHVVKLAPFIKTAEQLESLIDYTKKDLEASQGIKRKKVYLGNLVNSYSGWKQEQQPAPTTEQKKALSPKEQEERERLAEWKRLQKARQQTGGKS